MINHLSKKLIQTIHDFKFGVDIEINIFESGYYYERKTWHDGKCVETIVWRSNANQPPHFGSVPEIKW